jgi:3-oxoacyl-[acyl-carrier-protein] synthase II
MSADRRFAPTFASAGAVCALGRDWGSIWTRLLAGSVSTVPFREVDPRFGLDVPVAAVADLERTVATDGAGAAARLATMALRQIGPANGCRIYGASNHGESDLVAGLLIGGERLDGAARWEALFFDPVARACGERVQWVYGACSAGIHALAAALQDGCEDGGDVIVVAADALSLIEVIGFRRLGAVSQRGCRPFHRSRDGLLIGEGAVAIRLRTNGDAGTTPDVRLLGVGMSCDAAHATDPDPTGRWLGEAIDGALERARLGPSQIAAIICHGTGTRKNDDAEAATIAARWPSGNVPVTSVKGQIGHTMGPAGLFNLLVAVEACRSGVLPPTASDGGETLDKIDLVRFRPRQIVPNGNVLAISSGFGGTNGACIVGVAS